MNAVTKKAGAVLNILTKDLDELGAHKRVNNAEGTFMAVSVECIDKVEEGLIFSVAHYYEQNGDLMRDPEMCFLKGDIDGRYYPSYFRQDNIGLEEFSIVQENGAVTGFRAKMQKDHAQFANFWMENIKQQQGI